MSIKNIYCFSTELGSRKLIEFRTLLGCMQQQVGEHMHIDDSHSKLSGSNCNGDGKYILVEDLNDDCLGRLFLEHFAHLSHNQQHPKFISATLFHKIPGYSATPRQLSVARNGTFGRFDKAFLRRFSNI